MVSVVSSNNELSEPNLELKQRVAMDDREAWRVSMSESWLLAKTGYLEEPGKETAADLEDEE
jgi:hypothetical protein